MTICILLAERLVCRNENWHCLRARWCYIKTWTADSIFQPVRRNWDQSEKRSSEVVEEKRALLNSLGPNLGWGFYGRWKSKTKENRGIAAWLVFILSCWNLRMLCLKLLSQERNYNFFVYCLKIMRPFK